MEQCRRLEAGAAAANRAVGRATERITVGLAFM